MYRIAFLIIISLLSLGTVRTGAAQACTAYVNATDGDDSNPGTIVSPLRSFEFAFNMLPDASVLCVAAGEYFTGPDADGITLVSAGKSMEFVLNTFAGKTEVRFSETSFEVDVESGSVKFRAGSSSNLVFGKGLINTDDPDAPGLLNFLHTLRFISGNVRFEGLIPRIESSVGVPGYVNPDNNQKTAPLQARIEFGTGLVEGIFAYETAPRTFVFTGAFPAGPAEFLPTDLLDNRIVFDSEQPVSIGLSLDLANGSLRYLGSGAVTFTEDVRLEVENGRLEISGNAGPVRFLKRLSFSGDSDGSEVIQHAGSQTLSIRTLGSISNSASGNHEATIRIVSTGSLAIETFESTSSAAGFLLSLNIINDAGILLLGDPSSPQTLPGSVSNSGVLELVGPLLLGRNIGGLALQNSGTIQLNGHDLTQGSTASLINNGGITGDPGRFVLTGQTTITGTGDWPSILVSNVATWNGVIATSESLTITGSGELHLAGNSLLNLRSNLSSSSGGILTFQENSKLSVSGNVTLDDSEVLLSSGTEMSLTGDLIVGTSVFSERVGTILFTGETTQSVTASPSSKLPRLQILQSIVTLPQIAETGQIEILGGQLNHSGQPAPLIVAGLSVSKGTLTLSSSSLTFSGMVAISGGVVNLESTSPVHLNGDLIWSAGMLTLPASGIVFSGDKTQRFTTTSPQVIPALSVTGASTRLFIGGSVEIESGLSLDVGRILIDSGSTLSVQGDVLRTFGLLEGGPESVLRLSGSSIQRLSGFSSTVLPSLVLDGVAVFFPENISVSGNLRIVSGATTAESGSTVTVGQSVLLEGGILTFESNSTLRITSDASLISGTLRLEPGMTLTIGGDFTQTGTTVEASGASILFNGQRNQSVQLLENLTIESLLIGSAGTIVTLNDSQRIIVRRDVEIATGTILAAGTGTVELSGALPGAGVTVNGVFSGSPDGLLFSGPESSGVQYSLSGSGTFGPITVALAQETDIILGIGPSSEFIFSGAIRFLSGGIDVAGRTVRLSTALQFPSIERNLSSTAQDPGRIDGGWFTDSLGPLDFNPDGTSFDLTYSGNLSLIYLPGAEFPASGVRHVSILAPDLVNTPPVFAVSLPSSVAIGGNIVVSSGALLRLSGFDVLSASAFSQHEINGTISGAGAFRIEGNASLVTSPGGSGEIETLIIANPAESLPVIIDGIANIKNLEIDSGGALVTGLQLLDAPVQISDHITVSNATLTLGHSVRVGSGSTPGRFALSSAVLRLDNQANLIIARGAMLEADALSGVELVELPPSNGKTASGEGFIVFEGGNQILAETPIPRLRLEAATIDSQSDDLIFAADVSVSETFEMLAGDVILGPFDLLFNGSIFRKGVDPDLSDGGSDAFFGDFGSDAGRLVFGSSATMELGSDIRFFSSRFQIAAGAGNVVDVVSVDDIPHDIILFDRAFVIESGQLNLGLNDLVLKAGFGPAFIATGGSISASAQPVIASRSSAAHVDPALFPYDDTRYGEIIVGGAGVASMQLTVDFDIPNFTINGTVELDAGTNRLLVGSRLSFGRGGATFLTGGANRLIIGNGATILRRGSGTISHPLMFAGEVDLFYDLDDGSVSGTNSEFGPGALSTALEMPGVIRNLGIMAGQTDGTTNVVDLTAPVTITGTLVLFSGQLLTDPDEVTLAAGSQLILDEVDASSAASMGPGRLAASGPVDLAFTLRFSDLSTSDALVPNGGSDIDSLLIELGDLDAGNPVVFVLHKSLAVESLRVLSPVAGSSVNLAGATITTSFDVNIDGGTIRSGSLARLEVGGDLLLSSDAEVRGAISATVWGTAHVAGPYDGLELRLAGDLHASGPLGPSLKLVFFGEQQRLFAQSDLSVGSIEMIQQSTGSTQASMTIETIALPISISISNELLLTNGLLITGINEIILPGADGGFTRNVGEGDKSHIVGSVVRNAPDNTTTTLVFPVGGATRYRPLSLTFSEPLLTGTRLTITHRSSEPIGSAGLPLEFADGNIVRGLAGYSWTLFSSVNFAQSQPIDLSLTVEQTGQTPEAHRLIGRDFGNISDAWKVLSQSNSTDFESGLITLTAVSARGLLSPAGLEIAVGVPEGALFTTQLQFVHGLANLNDTAVSLSIGGQPVFSDIDFNEATSTVVISLRSEFESRSVSVWETESGEIVAEESIQFESDSGMFSALLSGSQNENILASRSYALAGPPPGTVLARPVNGSANLEGAQIRDSQGVRLLGPVDPGEIGSDGALQATSQLLELTRGTSPVFVEHYNFDFSGLDGTRVHILFSGGISTGANSPANKDLRASKRAAPLAAHVILSDGSVLAMSIVTGVDDPSAELAVPSSLVLHQNYPNPFNPNTTLRFDLPESARVRVYIIDLLGRTVSTIDAGTLPPGVGHTISFDGSHLASGMYIYRLEARTGQRSRIGTGKMLLVK